MKVVLVVIVVIVVMNTTMCVLCEEVETVYWMELGERWYEN